MVYIVPFVGFTAYQWRYRRWPAAAARPVPSVWRAYLTGQAAVLGLYGLALLIAPREASDFWPWTLDPFHARMYSTVFLTGAAGSFVIARRAAAVELLMADLTQLVLGSFAILGLIIVDNQVHRVDWSAAGTWVWIAAFGVIALAGLGLVWQARRADAPRVAEGRAALA